MAVTLATGSDELHLVFHTFLAELHLCRAEVLEHTQMSLAAKHALEFLSHTDTTANYYHIDIVGRTLKENVAHIASHYIAFHAKMVGCLTDLMENLQV